MTTLEISKIQPILNNVLIRPLEKPKQTAGGIHIPDAHQDTTQKEEGTVLAVGKGLPRQEGEGFIACQCRIGETVVYDAWAGHAIEASGETLKIVPESAILVRR